MPLMPGAEFMLGNRALELRQAFDDELVDAPRITASATAVQAVKHRLGLRVAMTAVRPDPHIVLGVFLEFEGCDFRCVVGSHSQSPLSAPSRCLRDSLTRERREQIPPTEAGSTPFEVVAIPHVATDQAISVRSAQKHRGLH
jgi:hypothetical protein